MAVFSLITWKIAGRKADGIGGEVARGLTDPAGGAVHDEVEIWTPCKETPTS